MTATTNLKLDSCSQLQEEERRLKHKLLIPNAYFKAENFDHLQATPRESLHQIFIGLVGEHIAPATMFEYEQVLRRPDLMLSADRPVISSATMAAVWKRLRDRLSSVRASDAMVEVTADYAAHFYSMYIDKHAGRHLTGDRIRILTLTLPFLLRDLIAPEVIYIMLYDMLYHTLI